MTEVLKIRDQAHYDSLQEAGVRPFKLEELPAPFTSQVHELLLESISKISDDWVGQLNLLRQSADAMEAEIIAYVGKVKADISALHSLGEKVVAEAARGREIVEELRKGLEKIA